MRRGYANFGVNKGGRGKVNLVLCKKNFGSKLPTRNFVTLARDPLILVGVNFRGIPDM